MHSVKRNPPNQADGAQSPVCPTCGTQYPPSSTPPRQCAICCDVRQFVPREGQTWTDLASLRVKHANAFKRLRAGLYEIRTQPPFAIGQRALLATTAAGNVLWDCVTLLDDATVDIVDALGGLSAVAISHPHYYATMVEWARAFGCRVWLHDADRQWVMRDDPALLYWSGERIALNDEATLLRVGGHFPGATVMHWSNGAGVLLSGDVLQVTPGRSHVYFMYSYPNYLPLSANCVHAIEQALDGEAYDAVYGSFANAEIERDAKRAVADSVARYVALLDDRPV
ncbi:MBL fold metallo-hydrolase [Paraburkholderia youngii]|uniref:MBL fold metallo-hydrolase n=1 Tax=Paraburkholderia youngii TaxID=2782701 RepID=A0A7W8LFJ1_9BURK|nr:MBL fold metallo-hydrolase [Paraburkholderia youngii]MBB5405640.1 hypothetical protein [Paraburkholderia youngii]NVI08989.1 MBL fold metallo-hydrolase [Paraburkholderia youngii]